jgi:hypothetical protein
LWAIVVVSAIAASPSCSCGTESCQKITVNGDAGQAESPSFVVLSRARGQDAHAIARACECWRGSLQRHWCSASEPAGWSPKCEIVIHPSPQSYLAAVGAGGSQTFASSWIKFGRDKKVSKRRIDLRGDGQRGIAAIPHEMTHVVLADLLNGAQPPRWADEGLAMLADTEKKQSLHERDLSEGLSRGLAFSTAELVTTDTYPHPSRVPTFYGQSVSLTAFLVTRDQPSKFIEFLRGTQEFGYDVALQKTYAIPSLRELERLWLAHRRRLHANPKELSVVLNFAQPLKRKISTPEVQLNSSAGAE